MGLIHMNARMYDATLGRFISADSFVQSPNNSQSFNRYSYVQNNPMKYTDPSGNFLKSLFKKVGRALKKIGGMLKKIGRFVRENAFQIGLMIVGIYAPWVAFAIRTTYATMTGGLRGLVSTLATAALFNVVGNHFPVGSFGSSAWAIKTVAHGVAGGISSVMQGGKFGEGFASAAVAQAFSPYIGTLDDKNLGISGERIAAAAVIGGVTSHLTGGKFANGAAMGAMARMFNDEHALNYKKKFQLFGRKYKDKAEFINKVGVPGSTVVVFGKRGLGHIPLKNGSIFLDAINHEILHEHVFVIDPIGDLYDRGFSETGLFSELKDVEFYGFWGGI